MQCPHKETKARNSRQGGGSMRTPQTRLLFVPKVILCKFRTTSASKRPHSLGWECWPVIKGLSSFQSRSPARMHLTPDLNYLDDGIKTSKAEAQGDEQWSKDTCIPPQTEMQRYIWKRKAMAWWEIIFYFLVSLLKQWKTFSWKSDSGKYDCKCFLSGWHMLSISDGVRLLV